MSWPERASASCGQTLAIFSRLSSPARGTKSKDQKTVRTAITKVMDHALSILLDLGRYVFCHTTSDGAGATLASNFMGSGSILACRAICYTLLALLGLLRALLLTAAAVESRVTKANGVGLYTLLRDDCIFSSSL